MVNAVDTNKTNQIAHCSRIEYWLATLTKTYAQTPSKHLAVWICYYLSRLLANNESVTEQQSCHYLRMQKYWQWQAQHGKTIT